MLMQYRHGVIQQGKASSHEAAENFDFMYSLYESCKMHNFKDIKVAVAGIGYVGLIIATLLPQHHHVIAVKQFIYKLNYIYATAS